MLVDAAGAARSTATSSTACWSAPAAGRRCSTWPRRRLRGADDLDAAIAASAGPTARSPSTCATRCSRALTAAERAFLRRTSILPQLTASACDAVLGTHGSGADAAAARPRRAPDRAARPHRPRLPLEPAARPDAARRARRRRARARERAAPPRGPLVRARARSPGSRSAMPSPAATSRLAGRIAWARRAALRRRRTRRAARRVARRFATPRTPTTPALALTAAVHHLLDRPPPRRRRRDGRRRAPAGARPPRRAGTAAVALLRAASPRPARPRPPQTPARARALLPADSPWHALALLMQGVAHHLDGDRDAAGTELDEAAGARRPRLPVGRRAPPTRSWRCSPRRREDWEEAARHAREARAALPPGGPDAVRALVAAVVGGRGRPPRRDRAGAPRRRRGRPAARRRAPTSRRG